MSDRVVSNGGARTVASIMREWSLTGELIASHTPCKQGTYIMFMVTLLLFALLLCALLLFALLLFALLLFALL
jgi:hypothetical protein